MVELNPLAWRDAAPNFNGYVIFSKIWGSHSHQTNVADSDVDYLAVFVAKTRDMLSMDPPPETVTGEKPDYQVHEVKKFCDLLMKGNPGIIEMLFTDKLMTSTPTWEELRAERKRFLTKHVVEQYLGWAGGQLHKLAAKGGKGGLHSKGGNYSAKWAYHLVRILQDAKLIALGQAPLIWKEGEDRELLMKIRREEIGQSVVEQMAKKMVTEIDSMKPWPLPDHGDRTFLNDWLLRIRGV
jgi:predicted nucleotidyltransferase